MSSCPRQSRCVPGIPLLLLLLLFAFPAISLASGKTDEASLWKALQKPDHFAMLRHALAPGTGDPADFMLGHCSTQRNLSEAGRSQARRIGERFRANGIEQADVYTSQWCRCRDTAELLGLGPVKELPALNSFFRNFERETRQTAELAAWLEKREPERPLVLVTHQVNITAMTGVFPDSGELVIVRRDRDGGFSVSGTINTD